MPVSALVPPAQTTDCTAENTCTALLLGGTGTGILSQAAMREALNGYFADDDVYTRENVIYPGTWDFSSIIIGATLLGGEIATTEGPMVIGGFSQGASVASQALYNLFINPKAPAKEDLRVMLVASPNYSPAASSFLVPKTKYDVVVITQEYDGFADAPDRWWNLIASTNAALGALYLHLPTIDADISTVPDENITVSVNSLGGVTTKYLVATEVLPLVRFIPSLAPVAGWLKEQVDAGYSRNDEKPAAASTSLANVRTEAGLSQAADAESAAVSDADDAPAGETETGMVDARDAVVSSDNGRSQSEDDAATGEEAINEAEGDLTEGPRDPKDEAETEESTDPADDESVAESELSAAAESTDSTASGESDDDGAGSSDSDASSSDSDAGSSDSDASSSDGES